MILFEKSYDSTLQTLSEGLTGREIAIWSFDDHATRRAAEARFAARGLKGRCYSAYKPLVNTFLHDIETTGLIAAKILYPVHPGAKPRRFLLESYPLGGLFPGVAFDFQARKSSTELPRYLLTLTYADGREAELDVLAPNRLHQDYADGEVLSPCGWLEIDGEAQAFETDFEQAFHETMAAIIAGPWQEEPYFQELNIAVTLPVQDEPLPYGDECLSLAEALHEEFYFSSLEHFALRSGRAPSDRHLRPGQIVPEIRRGDRLAVRLETRDWDAVSRSTHLQALETANEPLSQAQIAAELDALGGEPFSAQSVSGRQIEARYIAGSDRGVMISAGQHANETSAPIGVLRAAKQLNAQKGAHFSISPLENPDGYALHERLIKDNPRHMHHAARYTALGDDLEYRSAEMLHEKAIRHAAEELVGAKLHLNLHGYPAHEWTRPLSGYVPRAFEMWTIPKGFFLILRHLPGWAEASRLLMDEVTKKLNSVPGLRDYNQAQIALFSVHAGETGFEILNGFPVLISEDNRHTVPMTLITEYPDETVYSDKLRAAHEAQMATVLAAYDALQHLPEAVFPAQPLA